MVFSKFRGVVPWKNIQRHWGCNQRKVWSFSERSLLETCEGINRALATGTLSRDVCPHGPKIDSGYFLCTMYAWGLCPFLGMEIYSEKSLAPRNLSGINLGTTPCRHHTRGFGARWFLGPGCKQAFNSCCCGCSCRVARTAPLSH